jgi:hypothetical protein
MSIGKEIKVVLSLDDGGFSLKVRKAGDEVKNLSGQLGGLTGATDKVDAGMAHLSGNMKGFADGFASLNRSIASTVDSLQKNLLGGLNNVNRGIKDAASQAKTAATQQIDAKLKTLQNEIDTNKKLLESRSKAYTDLRKLESQMRSEAIGADLAAEKARRAKKAGSAASASSYENESARLNANADAVRREAAAIEAWIVTERNAQVARTQGITALENERRAVLSNVEARLQMQKVEAAVGKSNNAEIARIRQAASQREAQAAKESARQAADFARQKKVYATEEARAIEQAEADKVRAARAAEAERLRLAREAAAERRRIAAQELREQRAQAKMIADMWRGMAQMYAGAKIEGGLKNSVGEADDDQRARIMVQALNLPKNQEAQLFASSQKISDQLGFMSTKDVIKSKMSAISSLGYNHEDVIDDTLATAIKTANNMELLGAGHGDMQSTLRNIYGVAEMRQQTASPDAMLKTFDLLNKSMIGTAGKVNLADVETALRRVGGGASMLSDEGLVNMIGLIDQFKVSGGDGGSGGGVSTVGTIIKMMQAYATGKTKSNKAVREFIGAGILDDSGLDLKKDDAGVLKDAKNGNFKNVDLWLKDPVQAIQQMVPQIVEYTKKHKKDFYQNGADTNNVQNQMLAVQQYLQRLGITQSAVQAVTAVGTPAARERLEHQSQTINMADGVDKTAERLSGSYSGNVQKFQAQLTNFKVIIGDTILPALTKLLEYGSKVVMMFRDFGQNNPVAATLSTIAAGFGGIVLSVKGFLSMFGSAGVMGVLRALLGIGPAASGSVSAISLAFSGLAKVFKTVGLAILAYDLGAMIGTWLSSFDAFGLMTLTVGDRIDNAIARIIYGWKQLMVGGERAMAWARHLVRLDSDEEYAKKTAEIDARSATNGRRLESTLITKESKERQPAKLVKRKGEEPTVGAAKDGANPALEARIGNAIDTAGTHRKDRDPLNEALGEAKARMDSAKVKLDALVAGGTTIESLRAEAVALIEGKLEADDYSKNHDKKNRPSKDDPEIKKLEERTFQAMLYNEQIKAVTFANERMGASEMEADAAMNTLEAGGLAKQTDAFKALSKELKRNEERLGAGTEAFQKYEIAKAAALYNQARADDTTFALGYIDKNRQSEADLAETEQERIRLQLEQRRAAEDAQLNMRKKTLDDTYAHERELVANATLGKESGILTEQLREERLLALDANYQRTRDDTDKVYSERRRLRAEEEARAMESATTKMAREWKDVGKAVDQIGASAGQNFVSMIMDSLKTGHLALTDFIKNVLAEIAQAKLKQTLADPIESLVNSGADWLKGSVFGMKDDAEAAASQEKAAADTTAATASNTMATAIYSEVIPALNAFTAKLASAGAGGGGGGAGGIGGFISSFFGGGGDTAASATMTAGDFSAASMPELPFLAAFADGGIMTSMGPLKLRKYASGGVANSPQLAMYGEAGPEAYVPLPDGRSIPVTMKGGQGTTGANVQVNVINQTSTQVNASQGAPRFDGQQMILDVVLTAASSPGAFRSGMKEAMK